MPVPPTELAVKRTSALAGRPDGFRFPKLSFVVRVTLMEPPDATELLEAVTALSATE